MVGLLINCPGSDTALITDTIEFLRVAPSLMHDFQSSSSPPGCFAHASICSTELVNCLSKSNESKNCRSGGPEFFASRINPPLEKPKLGRRFAGPGMRLIPCSSKT